MLINYACVMQRVTHNVTMSDCNTFIDIVALKNEIYIFNAFLAFIIFFTILSAHVFFPGKLSMASIIFASAFHLSRILAALL